MKTIYVKDLRQKLLRSREVNWKKTIPTVVFLIAMFFLGRAAAEITGGVRQTGSETVETEPIAEMFGTELSLRTENWGLGFGKEGQKPTGNATEEELAKYGAYFCGPGEEKVLYLTFDCGYENGNTEPILDALKKHNAPATFFVVGHFLESSPEIVKRMVEDA